MFRIFLFLVFLALSGCSDKSSQPLVYGAAQWPGYEPAYIARELGFLDEWNIHLAEYTNNTEVLRAFRNDELHVAGLTLDEALSLRQSIPDLQVFLVADVSQGADVLMVRNDIRNLAQLRGRNIGVERTALGAYFLSLILRAAALSVQDVKIISLPLDEHVEAFRRGQVDAVVSFGLARDRLARLGAVALLDSSKMPGKIVDTLVVRAIDANKFRHQLDIFSVAWFRALKVIKDDPALAYPIMARREKVTVAEIDKTVDGLALLDHRQNIQQLSGSPPMLLVTAREVHTVLKEAGLASGSDNLSDFINPRIMMELTLD